jgi:hypothetical protein
MSTKDFLITTVLPFLITCAGLVGNEYRLFKIGSLKYKEFTNSVAMLLIGLATYIFLNGIFEIMFK